MMTTNATPIWRATDEREREIVWDGDGAEWIEKLLVGQQSFVAEFYASLDSAIDMMLRRKKQVIPRCVLVVICPTRRSSIGLTQSVACCRNSYPHFNLFFSLIVPAERK